MAVSEILKMEGFTVTCVYDGGEALKVVSEGFFDAVVLDIMMPVMDGVEVLKRMREAGNYTPVLMLTAKSTLDDRITGLSNGADDYLAKPFAMKELVARLRSILRRESSYRRGSLKTANLTLDLETGELSSDKGSLRLNNTESRLLSHFIRNADAFFTADEINSAIFEGEESPEKAELYIFYLKNKLRQIHAEVAITEGRGRFALTKKDE